MACRATTQAGQPCRMSVLKGAEFCFAHSPDQAAKRAKARRRGGVRSHGLNPNPAPLDVVIRSVSDVFSLLEVAGSDILAQKRSLDRARALIYLSSACLKCLETGEIEERLSALEMGATQ